MVEIIKEESNLVLVCYLENYFYTDNDWIEKSLTKRNVLNLKLTYKLKREHILEHFSDNDNIEESNYKFRIGEKKGEYYQLDNKVFLTENNFYIHESVSLNESFFTSYGKVSVFNKLDNLINEDLYIGGTELQAITEKEYKKIYSVIPKKYEVDKYIDARISAVLSNYFEPTIDAVEDYKKYINKKTITKESELLKIFSEYEVEKYQTVLDRLTSMLENEGDYSEDNWQKEMIPIILLLYPKYIGVLEKVIFKDVHNDTRRELDLLLVDYNGNIDLVEIKQPFKNKRILSSNLYRANHIPLRELSGAIMQIEKYIYYLNKLGRAGETRLAERLKEKLPDSLEVKITNPSGIIIMGRSNEMTENEKNDFEIIKRKYNNIIDILTYDDLLQRLKVTIEQISKL